MNERNNKEAGQPVEFIRADGTTASIKPAVSAPSSQPLQQVNRTASKPPKTSGGKPRYLIALIAAVVVVAAAIIVFIVTTGGANSETKLDSSATSFVDSAKTGKTDDIYAQFSDELKTLQTQDSLTAQLAGLGLNDTCKFTANGRDEGAEGKVTVKGTIECEQTITNAEGEEEKAPKNFNAHFGYDASGKLINYSIAPLN